jgi:hypothetical protein
MRLLARPIGWSLPCVVASVVGMAACADSDNGQQPDAIRSATELQEEYGLYCEDYKPEEIDAAQVPEHLRDLIPMAQKWGIGDDIIRSDCEDKSTEKERTEFQKVLRGRTEEVESWLDSAPPGEFPNDQAVPFMYMLLALDEMGIWPDPPSTTESDGQSD